MKTFVLASANPGKLKEMRALLSELDIRLLSLAEAGFTGEIEETGLTFEENARIKAEAACKATGLPAISDDSGFEVDALNGEPGVYSARYTGRREDTDEDRNRLVLDKMRGVEHRGAAFVSCICAAFPNGDHIETRGDLRGQVLTEPQGAFGFGYDSIFAPEGSRESLAQLRPEEKNAISHRGIALGKFIKKLREYYADK